MIILFAIFAGLFPRLGTLFIWLARPNLFSIAFGNSFVLPILGIIFLPFTTLMYVIIWTPTGLAGWDWFWVILALFLDLSVYGGNAYANNERVSKSTA